VIKEAATGFMLHLRKALMLESGRVEGTGQAMVQERGSTGRADPQVWPRSNVCHEVRQSFSPVAKRPGLVERIDEDDEQVSRFLSRSFKEVQQSLATDVPRQA